jgi:hypothetical protein
MSSNVDFRPDLTHIFVGKCTVLSGTIRLDTQRHFNAQVGLPEMKRRVTFR